jgi:hypothetical protein
MQDSIYIKISILQNIEREIKREVEENRGYILESIHEAAEQALENKKEERAMVNR